ncbi:MAG: phage tail protein [Clostridium sp.]|nr:phage tail protein [Clostridium sp.]
MKGIVTETGRKKLCTAHAGDYCLPKILYMAFGNGGLSEEGIVREPTGRENILYSELLRKEIEKHSYTDETQTTCRYTARLEKPELSNQSISELGLYDEENDLVAIKTFLPKRKDEDMEFIFDMDEVF